MNPKQNQPFWARALPGLLAVPVLLVGVFAGMSGCEVRGLVSPDTGSVRIETIDHPVSIRTTGAEGGGWIQALTSERTWTVIHINPAGNLNFNEPIPEEYWDCATRIEMTYSERRGCVAVLQVGDERGAMATTKKDRRLYVCTEDYVQTSDRRHCDYRTARFRDYRDDGSGLLVGLSERETKAFPASSSKEMPTTAFLDEWEGDSAQRLFYGTHEFTNSNNAWDPAFPWEYSATWREFGYEPGKFDPTATRVNDADLYSVDIGVCSVFIPWKWEDRIPGAEFNETIGSFTNDLGIGEVLVEGMIDNPINQSVFTENAKRWMDTLTNIWSRTDVSPEFHFRTKDGARQMCMVQYVAANNRLQTAPDAWYRWDQAIAAFFLELFRIADCPTKPIRIQYCGEIKYSRASGGNPATTRFEIDEESVVATMYNYPGRPACRNQFKPTIENELPEKLVAPAEDALTANLGEMVTLLPLAIGGEIRRVESTPSGIYLVTAESATDPQYGIGECTPTLESTLDRYGKRQGDRLEHLPATGITRPMP